MSNSYFEGTSLQSTRFHPKYSIMRMMNQTSSRSVITAIITHIYRMLPLHIQLIKNQRCYMNAHVCSESASRYGHRACVCFINHVHLSIDIAFTVIYKIRNFQSRRVTTILSDIVFRMPCYHTYVISSTSGPPTRR